MIRKDMINFRIFLLFVILVSLMITGVFAEETWVEIGETATCSMCPSCSGCPGEGGETPIPNEGIKQAVEQGVKEVDKGQAKNGLLNGIENLKLQDGTSVDLSGQVRGAKGIGSGYSLSSGSFPSGTDILATPEDYNVGFPGGGNLGGNTGQVSGGGSGLQGLQEALSVVQQLLGFLQQIGEQLKGGSNGEGSTFVSDEGGDLGIELDEGAEFFVQDEEEIIGLSQDDEEGKESITTLEDGKIDKLIVEENTKVEIPEQAIVHVPEGSQDTIIYNEGIQGDYEDDSFITGAVIFAGDLEQFVKLKEHDLELSGEGVIVEVLKSFKEISAKGADLDIKNGDSKIKFIRENTYYNRKIENINYNIFSIKNNIDYENEFKVFKNAEKHRLFDEKKRISVGNMWVEHPRLEGVRIASIRKAEWGL